jgi:murein DD-endopeptidase MepM/ murein hydrolase activator NlpD
MTPVRAQAGIFDTVTRFLATVGQSTSTEEINPSNLQTAALLKANSTQIEKENIYKAEAGTVSVTSGPLRMSTEEEVYIPSADTISVYVVKKGDTLNSIAKLFDVSVNTIVWANNLSARKVEVGQTLTILPVSGTTHTIVKGDTLKSIAQKYSADAEDIGLFNGITTQTNLIVGDTLIVPDGEVAEVVKTKEEKKAKEAKSNKVSKSIKTIVKNLSRSGYFVRPIQGGTRTTGLHGHNAVDLAAPAGTSIVASASGQVIVSKSGGYNGGYGNYIVVAHPNGTQTLYAHNSTNLVSVGESVAQGQVIAKVGSTGKSTGPHVHFEVRGATNPF